MTKEKLFTNIWSVCLLTLLCCFLWGSAFPCIKIGYKLFQVGSNDTMSQILFAGVRFTLAGILVILFGSIREKRFLKPKKSSWKMIEVLCLLQTVAQYTFFYIGMAHTPGVKASIITGVNIFITVLVAALIFRTEKLTFRKMLGCLLGFAGIVVINWVGTGTLAGGFTLLGEGFILMSAVSHAFSSSAMKLYSAREDPVVLSGYQFTLGGIILSLWGFLGGGRIHPTTGWAYLLLLYMALISSVAYTVWSLLLKYNPISRIAVFRCANPIFGALLSILLLGNEGSVGLLQTVIALLLVCGGILIVNYRKNN